MGFLDFFKSGEKKEEISNTKDVILDNFEEVLSEQLKDKIKHEKGEVKRIYNEIRKNVEEIVEITKKLEKQQFEPGDKSYAAINMTKNNYVKRVTSLISKKLAIENFDYREISIFATEMQNVIHGLMNVHPKQAILLTNYFKNEISQMAMLLKTADKNCKYLIDLIEKSDLRFLDEAINKKDGILKLAKSISLLDEEIKALKIKSEEKKRKIEIVRKEIENLKDSEEMKKLKEITDFLKMLEEEREVLKSKIYELFSPLKKPFKRIEHALISTKTREKEKFSFFSKFFKNFDDLILKEIDEKFLSELIAFLKTFPLKENEIAYLKDLERKIENGYASSLLKRYEELTEEGKKKKVELDNIEVLERQKRKEMEKEMLEKEAEELEKAIERINEEIESRREKLKSGKEDLEKMVFERSGIKINILV